MRLFVLLEIPPRHAMRVINDMDTSSSISRSRAAFFTLRYPVLGSSTITPTPVPLRSTFNVGSSFLNVAGQKTKYILLQ